MTRTLSRIILPAIVVFAACVARSEGRYRPTPSDSDVLTRRELATLGGATQNAYSAVERLRPLFLATRPGSRTLRGEPPRIYVFINGNLAGDVETLKTIPLGSIESIRRVQATTAYTQSGETRTGDGVLMVRIR